MPERKTRFALTHMRRLVLAVACGVLSGQGVQARQDEQTDVMRGLLKSLQVALEDDAAGGDAAGGFSAQALIRQAGLAGYVTGDKAQGFVQPVRAAAGGVAVAVTGRRLDLRLVMTMIAQSYGPEDTFGILAAQTGGAVMAQALVLQSGRATLADLRRLLQENDLAGAGAGAGALRLDVPLIIWKGATLDLRAGDKIALNRATGAFLANFGHLDMDGAEIAGAGDASTISPSFQPFVITADGGSVQIRNARFAHLGFGPTLTFAGFSLMRGILHAADRQNLIENTRFEDLVSVTTNGAAGTVIEGNRFRDMRGSSVIIYRTLGATVRGNVFTGRMPTNAIRLIEGSARGVVTGNIILGGKHAGILVGNASTGAQISHNIIWRRDGGGISVLRSDCGTVRGNHVVDNRQKGIEVRVSLDTRLEGNTILSNHNAGIWVAGQPKGAQTWLVGNTLAANNSGIAGAIGESIHLDGNNFARQFPQFLSGDLTSQFERVATDLHGKAPIELVAADSVKHTPVSAECSE